MVQIAGEKLLSVLGRRDAAQFFENPVKIFGIVKPGLFCRFINPGIFSEQFLCVINAASGQVDRKVFPGILFEELAEISGRKADILTILSRDRSRT